MLLSLRHLGALAALWAVGGCATARFAAPGGPPSPSALPHLGMVASLGFAWSRPEASGALGTDTVVVYGGVAGGWVAHTIDRQPAVHVGASSGPRTESWLEVDAQWRPVRGWERRTWPGGGCATAFVVREDTLWLDESPLDGHGRAGHGDHGVFGVPAAFAVDFIGPAAWGYRATAAVHIGRETMPVVGFAACDSGVTGPRTVRFGWGLAASVGSGGAVRPDVPRWVQPVGWGLPGSPTDAQRRRVQGHLGAGTVYVDVATGLGVGAWVGADTATAPPSPDAPARMLQLRSGWFILPDFTGPPSTP